MADTTLKVGLTLKKDQFKKDVQDAVKDAKKELQTLNGEEILTPESIKKQVEEREKILKKKIKEDFAKGSSFYESEAQAFEMANRKTRGTGMGGETGGEFIYNGVQYETPAMLEEKLNKKMQEQQVELERLRIAEETKKVEEQITKENEQQTDAIKEASDDRKENVLDTIGKGAKDVANEAVVTEGAANAVAQGMESAAGSIALIVGVVQIALKVIYGIVLAIVSFISNCVNAVIGDSEELQHKIKEIKAMIESIYYVVGGLLKNAIEWILNAIIEIMRFVQHVVYALTGVDIFAKASERFKENLKAAEKSSKEINKQLMGFDEVNKLTGDDDKKKETFDLDLGIRDNYFEDLWNKFLEFINKVKVKIDEIADYIHKTVQKVHDLHLNGGNIFDKWFDTSKMPMTFEGLGMMVEGFLNMVEGKFRKFISGPFHIIHGLITGDWEEVWQGCKIIFFGFIQDLIGQLQFLGGLIASIVGFILDLVWNGIKWLWDHGLGWLCEQIGQAIIDIWNMLKNGATDVWNTIWNNLIQPLIDAYDKYIKPIIDGVKDLLGLNGSGFNLNILGNASNNSSSLWDKISGGWNRFWGHDNGGIILAQPGHGVPLGDVMSERRNEAIIPFENPTAMEMIGEAIGKYVNIAIDNKMVVDSKILAQATSNAINKERFLMNR